MKNKTMKRLVLFCIAFLVVYTAVMVGLPVVMDGVVATEYDTLTQWVFTVFGVELVAMMVKKIMDKRGGKDDE